MMNERLKELWEESQHWNGSDDGRGGLKILSDVRTARNGCVRAIKEHFGVEE
jgi:hypothetical protein